MFLDPKGENNLYLVFILSRCMSLFNEILAEFLKNNPLPKNKTALEEWSKNLFKEWQTRRSSKAGKSVKPKPKSA